MKIALLQNDKSFLSFDLKDLLWLILVVGVWATQDYRIKYTANVLRWNGELQEKIGQQNVQIAQLKEQVGVGPPNLRNIIRLEELRIHNVINSVEDFSSIPPSAKVSFVSQLQAVLDELNQDRDIIASELDRLKAVDK